MPFDLTTAKPVSHGFDPATSTTVTPEAPTDTAITEAPQDSKMSTVEKVGLGALGAGAGALALKYPALRAQLENLMARTGVRAAETPLWKQAGLRTAEESPVARNLAGKSGQEALQLHNMEVSRTIAANEAGIPAEQAPHLSQDVLEAARREPNSVYERVANTVPAGQLNNDAKVLIQSAGLDSAGRMSAGSPQAQTQIEALRRQLLDPNRQFTGQQFVNEVRGLRQEGFTNVGSDDVSNQQLGRAQLDMSRAIEGHILDSIPPELKDQFLAARKTLAKNATIQKALRGNNIDLQVLARIQRNEPQLLDGGTKTLADFGATHPEVSRLPSDETRYNPPGAGHDVEDISLKSPTSWVRPLLGNLARKALVGDPEAAQAAANQTFPARSAGFFSPPPPAPRPKFGGYLPSPEMVNAGGGAATENTLRDLGLTPDVQAAGLQHPATARLQALREQLSRPPMEEVPFQGLQKWGDFSLAPQAPPAAPQEGIPFENVLEQGGTQGKPIAGIKSGYRPAPQSPKGPNMRTPSGAPELTEFTLHTPSDAQMNFRNQQAAARLRKVAGDLSLEGPGGNTGDPLARIRAALERHERGFADGGEVRSSSPASPGVGGAVKDALTALRDYFVTTPQRRLQAEREGVENTVIDDTAQHAPARNPPENYADGGGVPSISQEEAIAQATRALSDLVSLHEVQNPQPSQAMAGGGRVELMERIGEYLDRLAQERAARNIAADVRAPDRPKPPLIQSDVDPLAAAAEHATTPYNPMPPAAPPQNPLPPDFLLKRQAFADGGSTEEDSHSSIRKLADAARTLNLPFAPTDPQARARVATNLAALAYGLDAQGRPALGGRAWTRSQGGTPAGVLDALTATPHNLIQLAATVDKYLPGKSNPQFWASVDPQWSRDASDRLGMLRQRLQQSASVAPATSLQDSAIDMVTDPALIAPTGAAKLASKGSALRNLLNWSTGSTPETAPVTQGGG